MIDYFPFYDKFRAVSSIQVIIELIIPLIAAFGLYKIFEGQHQKTMSYKKIIYPSLIFLTTLFCFYYLANQFLNFNLKEKFLGHIPEILDMIINERKSIFRTDVMRSIFIVSVLFASIFAVKKNTYQKNIYFQF